MVPLDRQFSVLLVPVATPATPNLLPLTETINPLSFTKVHILFGTRPKLTLIQFGTLVEVPLIGAVGARLVVGIVPRVGLLAAIPTLAPPLVLLTITGFAVAMTDGVPRLLLPPPPLTPGWALGVLKVIVILTNTLLVKLIAPSCYPVNLWINPAPAPPSVHPLATYLLVPHPLALWHAKWTPLSLIK